MKKQTAVELAKNNIEGEALAFIDGFLTFNEFMDNINKCFQQALEIEKQQIEDAWDDGFDRGYGYSESKYDSSQQYYNKTYKK